MLDFDSMLAQVGEFGLYQKMLFFFQAPFCIFVTFVSFGSLFMQNYPPEYWCMQGGGMKTGPNPFQCSRLTPGQKMNLSFPFTDGAIDPCNRLDINAEFVRKLSEDERIYTSQGTCDFVSAPCRFNGSLWYSNVTSQRGKVAVADSRSGTKPGQSSDNNSPTERWTFSTVSTTTDKYSRYSRHVRVRRQYYGNRITGNNPGSTSSSSNGPGDPWGNSNGGSYVINGQGSQGSNANNGPGYNRYNVSNGQGNGNYPNYGPGSNWNNQNNGQGSNNWNDPNNGQGSNNWNDPNNGQGSNNWNKPNNGQGSNNWNKPNNGQGSNWDDGNSHDGNRPPISPTAQPQKSCLVEYSLNPTTRLEFENVTSRRNKEPIGILSGSCSKISYESPPGPYRIYYPTVVEEGNWWCNADLYVTISQGVFFVGAIVGGFVIGYVADTMGRVPALVLANVVGAIGGVLSTLTTNFYLFTFFRFITGMSFDNCFVMMYILVLEFCGPTYRTIVANLSIAIFYTIGTLILPWLAVWCSDWRLFGRVIALPMLLALVALLVVPESSRWLLSKGKAKRATDILRQFAKVNRRKVDEKIFVEFEEGAQKIYDEVLKNEVEPSLTEAFKTPRLRMTFILLVIMWSSIALVYDGHNRNILNLANAEWNLYWMFTIASLTEFPADILLILTLDRFGRRWLAFASLSLSGICSFIAATVPQDLWTASLVMAMLSRFWVNVSFNIGLQYASELLPTVIRAQGVNIIHIMGYVASIISPVIAQIGRTQPALSLILLGAVALTGGILSLFLSETLGEDLPNSLEEAEAFGKHQSFWNCPICAKPKEVDEVLVEEVPEAVRLRNSLRASSRGETYRSSIITNPNRQSRFGIAFDPLPNEKSKLRRVYTK